MLRIISRTILGRLWAAGMLREDDFRMRLRIINACARRLGSRAGPTRGAACATVLAGVAGALLGVPSDWSEKFLAGGQGSWSACSGWKPRRVSRMILGSLGRLKRKIYGKHICYRNPILGFKQNLNKTQIPHLRSPRHYFRNFLPTRWVEHRHLVRIGCMGCILVKIPEVAGGWRPWLCQEGIDLIAGLLRVKPWLLGGA